MDINNSQRAKILVNALPYIKEYSGKIIVIKYGGAAMKDAELKKSVIRDVVLLNLIGIKVVLVHGGGPEITDTMNRMGKKTDFINGLRVTDEETVKIAQMVLSGKVNKDIVNLLECAGGNAIGLSGVDSHMIIAKKKDEKLGFVGEIEKINIKLVLDVLEKNYIPVISTIGCDKKGNIFNINADTVAQKIASNLKAEGLIILTDTPGVLKNPDDPSTLINHISISKIKSLIENGTIKGGMIPKVEGCSSAVKEGVKKVFIIDGRVPHSILIETLTDEGIGTMFN